MKILVTAAMDATNLAIENILRELLARGHFIEVFAVDVSPNTIRMFNALELKVNPINALTSKKISEFDIAFTGTDAMSYLRLADIYIFSYNFITTNAGVTEGADFMFSMVQDRKLRYTEDCATMPIGNAKNDVPILPSSHKNRFLYIDAGHNPWGEIGKTQIVDMLLNICRTFPNYDLVVKPRWLLGNNDAQTHKSSLHIYNLVHRLTNNELPKNLILLNEHRNLQELIDDCDCVITTSVSCYLDVALRNKPCLVVDGLDSEEQMETRRSLSEAYDDARKSGCCVNYKDIVSFLPKGIYCNPNHMKKRLPYFNGVSEKIANVMEYLYDNFIKQGDFPRIQKYDYETYRNLLEVDNSLNFRELKYKRFKNAILYRFRRIEMLKTELELDEYYNLLEKIYHSYPLTQAGFASLERRMDEERKELVVKNKEKCMKDSIDQSILLQCLFDTKRQSDILEIPEEKILCTGPYHFYLGHIYYMYKDRVFSIYNYCEFLKEANSRSFEKYFQEKYEGIQTAYMRIIDTYDGSNAKSNDYANLYLKLYERQDNKYIPPQYLKKMHDSIPCLCEKLVANGEDKLALQCAMQYMNNAKTFSNNDEISRLNKNIFYRGFKTLEWLPKKIKRGIHCLNENGYRYTAKLFLLKVKESIKKVLPDDVWKIRSTFKHRILFGFDAYSRIVIKHGVDSFLHITTTSNGDAFLVSKYYNNYISSKFQKYNNIVVGGASSLQNFAEWFGVKNAEKVLAMEYQSLIYLYMFVQEIPIDILHYHLTIRHTGILMYLEIIHNFNFMEMLAEIVFPEIRPSRPVLPDCAQEIKQLFEEYNLQVGKTIILSPYAKGVKKTPIQYWLSLSKALIQKGYSVCTNAVESQLPIIGTCKIALPYEKMKQFLNTAGYFVSNRSGTDDITHDAVCKRVEVYAKDNWPRSIMGHIAESYSYSKDYVLIPENDIDECVQKTLKILGID